MSKGSAERRPPNEAPSRGLRQIVARLRGEIAEPPGPEYSESLLEQLARDRESRLATG